MRHWECHKTHTKPCSSYINIHIKTSSSPPVVFPFFVDIVSGITHWQCSLVLHRFISLSYTSNYDKSVVVEYIFLNNGSVSNIFSVDKILETALSTNTNSKIEMKN